MKQLVALAGLPRSGSTLLSAILHQNPSIHAEGNSAICQIMWDVAQSCRNNCSQQLLANRRYSTEYEILKEIPRIYYRHVQRPIVVDKCRSWTLPANQDLLRQYVSDTPRTIVLTRPVDEIVESFARLYASNGLTLDESALRAKDSEPLMRSLSGVEWAKENNRGEFLFIAYRDLVTVTDQVLDRIYSFINAPRFNHKLDHIHYDLAEDDSVYGLDGMHQIRSTISPRERVS